MNKTKERTLNNEIESELFLFALGVCHVFMLPSCGQTHELLDET